MITPSTRAWGTVASMNFWRRSSLLVRLMPSACPGRCWGCHLGVRRRTWRDTTTSGSPRPAPCLCSGRALHHHQQGCRSPGAGGSSLRHDADHGARVRAVAAAARGGIWFMIAAPSTSQPITPTSAR